MRIARYIAAALLALLPSSLQAQGLPKLKQAEEVTTGTLPNGIVYYLVANPATKGRADFALVQENLTDIEQTREALSSLEHLSPKGFLARSGVPYTAKGYVEVSKNARTFHFPDVDISSKTTADSTLLMMLDLMRLSSGEQAIVISGDIDRTVYKNTLHTLGLTIPHLTPGPRVNLPKQGAVLELGDTGNGPIEFVFRPGSVARDQANTPVPLVAELLGREMSYIITDRIRAELQARGIPCYMDAQPNSMKIYVADSLRTETLNAIGGVFADISKGNVTLAEFDKAKRISLARLIDTGLKPGKSNAFYVQRCVSAARFGTNLASQDIIRNFFKGRKITPKRELELFNNFAHAFLGDEWTETERQAELKRYPILDEVLKTPIVRGIKLANTTIDPVSGGKLWTFSNGVKVIFKPDRSADGFNFCFAARGGASSVRDIHPGESAYLTSALGLGRVAGIPTYDFREMLLAEGIEMSGKLTLEDMRIYGKAQKEDIESVLKALIKIGYAHESDDASFDYFRKSAIIKSESVPAPVTAVMDSLICPDYMFLDKSSGYNIREDLPERVAEYLTSRFSNAADGIFVFTGNISEEELLQALTRYIGNFKTSRIYSLREPVDYNLHSGRSTHIVDGEDHSVNLAATGLFPATIDNYYTFLIAQEAVKKQLARRLAPLGMYAEVSGRMDLTPVERMTLYITCRPCGADGLPSGVEPSAPLAAVRTIRAEFSDLMYFSVSDAEFKAYKEIVRGNVARELNTPEGMIKYCLYRYSEGKDLISLYSRSIDRIDVDDVRLVLEEILSSGVVEYVVK
ncbi:MAG: hypothetical protein J5748_02410 [Bacteroidales bacterium]|nr:hypothetical protein [Bacteroidales bacterium]